MSTILRLCVLILAGVTSTFVFSQAVIDTPRNEASTSQSKATIEGLVRDIACPIQNVEATATHLSMKCLRSCAKAGSPLVILTKNGELYVPISDQMPTRINGRGSCRSWANTCERAARSTR